MGTRVPAAHCLTLRLAHSSLPHSFTVLPHSFTASLFHSLQTGSLHGEMSKVQRAAVLRDFTLGASEMRALLVSDVAARGIDIPEVDVVFNLELPSNAAHYAHR